MTSSILSTVSKFALDNDAVAAAVEQAASNQLRADAFRDMGNLALAGAGAGLAGRGVVGLLNLLRGPRPQKRLAGPAELPLPLPYKPDEEEKVAGVTQKTALPYYGPGMLLAGLAGVGLGWKGADMVLDSRRKAEREKELEAARSQFHDALLSQYDAPLAQGEMTAKVAADRELGRELDALFATFEKTATLADWGGTAAGAYGTYATLAALLGGTWAYDKAQKRSRRSVLESALKKRQRNQFAQSPTEIYAVPEPVATVPSPV